MATRIGLIRTGLALGIWLSLWGVPMAAPTASPQPPHVKERVMQKITGHFEVTLTPQAAAVGIEAAKLGRPSIAYAGFSAA